MITKQTYTSENIRRIQEKFKVDPELAQRAVFALGLVEALRKAGLDFLFKGGSSLMLVFEVPKRLSTDVDILVPTDCEIDPYIQKASEFFPFLSVQESVRTSSKSISKKHYKFTYLSPIRNRPITVLLDVLFAENHYAKTLIKPIRDPFLLSEGDDLSVKIPSPESILGDKLTAFAPHTIGVRYFNEDFSNDKRLEVMKQLFDVVSLLDIASDFADVRNAYFAIAKQEIFYRNIDVTPVDCLMDSFQTALSLLSWGKFGKEDYRNLVEGTNRIRMHIVNQGFSMNATALYAAKTMLLSACLIQNADFFHQVIKPQIPLTEAPYNKINFILKNKEQEAFDIAVTAL